MKSEPGKPQCITHTVQIGSDGMNPCFIKLPAKDIYTETMMICSCLHMDPSFSFLFVCILMGVSISTGQEARKRTVRVLRKGGVEYMNVEWGFVGVNE